MHVLLPLLTLCKQIFTQVPTIKLSFWLYVDLIAMVYYVINLIIIIVTIAADGPGDRFIVGESQAGQQVSSYTNTTVENKSWMTPHCISLVISYTLNT